jgi:hypothetical protein
MPTSFSDLHFCDGAKITMQFKLIDVFDSILSQFIESI